MTKDSRSRKIFVLFWIVGFFCGVFIGRNPAIGECEVHAAEELVISDEMLPVVFYDDKGRKVCVRQDGVLQLSESFHMEIPLGEWAEEQTGFVELTVFSEEGRVQKNRVCIQRKSLHNEEK